TLQRDWLAIENPLTSRVESLAQAVAAGSGLEIERKYLLSALPPLPRGHSSAEIEQGWLPGIQLRERIRRVHDADGTHYFRTLKLGKGIARTEIEESTTADVFDALWPLTSGARVHKRRHKVAVGDLVWEIDEFIGRDLWLAEVELDDAEQRIDVPEWLAPWIVRDVTEEKGFTNLELSAS
ncbi:MAG: hypothetical protein ABIP42_15225, partial [Planctomycetota bacterium]